MYIYKPKTGLVFNQVLPQNEILLIILTKCHWSETSSVSRWSEESCGGSLKIEHFITQNTSCYHVVPLASAVFHTCQKDIGVPSK